MQFVWFLAGVALAALGWITMALWARCSRRSQEQSPQAQNSPGALAEMAQLAGGLAHEIKNPLSTINVNLGLLAEDLQRVDDDEHRRWL
ncbi:MAG: histidine kinase dimerization/phospho-acceptor domain-containing protein, partial [Planctomycetota bacterium]